ncbi:MAG: carboxypeptidase regulatory-like domain-containing protein [Theionarchaea archaeon]|nr:carboxypeptidase regulatory-like domain-containing protein [Theionarchaea archaeon]
MKKEHKLILISVLVIFSVAIAAMYQITESITVQVYDAHGNPLEGVIVAAYDDIITNAQGKAVIEICEDDIEPLTVTITKEGYEPFEIVLDQLHLSELGVILYASETGFIQGTVYLGSKDTLAGSGYEIEVYTPPLNMDCGTVITDENSQFSFEVSVDKPCILVVADFPHQEFKGYPGDNIDIVIKDEEENSMWPLRGRGMIMTRGSRVMRLFPEDIRIQQGRNEFVHPLLWVAWLILVIIVVGGIAVLIKRRSPSEESEGEPKSPPQ